MVYISVFSPRWMTSVYSVPCKVRGGLNGTEDTGKLKAGVIAVGIQLASG